MSRCVVGWSFDEHVGLYEGVEIDWSKQKCVKNIVDVLKNLSELYHTLDSTVLNDWYY